MKFRKQATACSFMVLALTVIISIFYWNPVMALELPEYQVVAENDNLILYFNETTLEVAVYQKSTEQVWFSNPYERDTVEKIARGAAKNALGAQLRINYFTPQDVQRSMDSYNDSLAYGQYEIVSIENGIRVEYLLGKEWDDQYYVPLIVDKSIFEEDYLANLSASDRRTIQNLYALVEIVEAPEGVTPTLLNKYVINAVSGGLNTREARTIHEVFLDHLVRYKDSLSNRNDVKEADLQPFLGKTFYILKQRERDMLPWDKDALIEITRESGFDPYQIGENYQLFDMSPGKPNVVLFYIPIEYTLEDDNFVVRVPVNEVEYPVNVLDAEGQRVTYPLVSIDVLPYFGAAAPTAEGYMFVPDGSGALIYLNNGKTHLNAYSRRIYGRDLALTFMTQESSVIDYQNKLPVFGLKADDTAWFAIIEDGASIAQLNADISGKRISYNTIYPQFRIIEYTSTSLQGDSSALLTQNIHGASAQWVQSGKNSINVYQNPMYSGDIKIRYALLTDEKANYVGMAHYYQDYLVEKYGLKRIEPQEQLPLFLEIVGAVDDMKPILGVPREVIVPLTTYKELEAIVTDLADRGIPNLYVDYVGWMNDGYMHGFPRNIKLESALGSKRDFLNLTKTMENIGATFYPEVNFLIVNQDSLFDGYRVRRDAVRALDRRPIEYLLSPAKVEGLVDRYLDDHLKLGLTGLTLSDIQYSLYSDYNRKVNIGREDAVRIYERVLAKLAKDNNQKLHMRSLNAYAIPYANSVSYLPLSDSGLDIVDESIPFMPIVLHGYVSYASEPINRTGDGQYHILKMAEAGALPYYFGFMANPDVIKGSIYGVLFTGQYSTWVDEAVAVYEMFNEHFNDVQGLRIVDHQKVAEKVYLTVYENGKSVVVNYSNHPMEFNGVTVESKSFRVFKGE